MTGAPGSGDSQVAAYKRLLRSYLDRRPSGTRQRLAAELGTHKSFISQITNPTYRVPLPAQHVVRILTLCRFTDDERETFLAAWRAAHPEQSLDEEAEDGGDGEIRIRLPEFADPDRRRAVAELIRDMAERIIALVLRDATTPRRGREESP